MCALSEGEEVDLGCGARAGFGQAQHRSVVGVMRVMRGDDPRVPRGGQSVAGDLRDTASGAGDDHQFVAGDPAPHLRPLVPVRGRVPNVSPADGLVEADEALLTEGKQMRILGQHVQPPEFGGQPLGRGGPDGAVRAGVDLLAPPLTCVDELGETRVFLEQVRLGRHQIGLRDLDRVLGAALRFRVERFTRVHDAAVMLSCGDDVGVSDGDVRRRSGPS